MKIKEIVFCSLLLLMGGEAIALTVYNNFSSNLSFDVDSGHGVGSNSDLEIGMMFSPTQSGFLDNIYVAASKLNGEGNIGFSLYSSVSGEPGNILESFQLSNLVEFQTSFPAQKLESNLTPFLESGKSYWLTAFQPNYPDTVIWNYAGVDEDSVVALRDKAVDTDWLITSHEMQFALQVNVIPTPLPASIIFFVSGIIGFALPKLRFKFR